MVLTWCNFFVLVTLNTLFLQQPLQGKTQTSCTAMKSAYKKRAKAAGHKVSALDSGMLLLSAVCQSHAVTLDQEASDNGQQQRRSPAVCQSFWWRQPALTRQPETHRYPALSHSVKTWSSLKTLKATNLPLQFSKFNLNVFLPGGRREIWQFDDNIYDTVATTLL